MSNDKTHQPPAGRPAPLTRQNVLRSVHDELQSEFSAEEIDAAARKVAAGMMRAIAAAPDRGAIESCSQESIGNVIRQTARDGLELGGIMADAYLVPRGGQLTRPVTHRGLARLAQREGIRLRATVVGPDDHLVEQYGLAVEHEQIGRRATTLADVRAVIVTVQRGPGDVEHHVVPGESIRQIASGRQSGPVWRQYPVEMAMKSAIKWVFARGAVVIPESLREVVEVEAAWDAAPAASESAPTRRGKAALPDYSATDAAPAGRVEEPEYTDPGRADDGGAE